MIKIEITETRQVETNESELHTLIVVALNVALDAKDVKTWQNWPGTAELAHKVVEVIKRSAK